MYPWIDAERFAFFEQKLFSGCECSRPHKISTVILVLTHKILLAQENIEQSFCHGAGHIVRKTV